LASNLEIHRVVRAISITLDETVAFYETYVPSGQDAALIERVNKADYHPAFNIISDALHREVILGLCRVWDTRADTANLNRLADEFRDAKVIAELKSIGHAVDPGILSNWLAEIDAGSTSDELLALRRARHRALAHTATPNEPYKGKARVAAYGDERKLMERTIPLVEQAGAFIGYSYVSPFAEQRRVRQEHSKKFWESVGL
jgi:AbiU2